MVDVTVRRLARVRVDTLIWLVFAAVLFVISALLTLHITNIEDKTRHGIAITFLGSGNTDPRPTVAFNTNGKTLELRIENIGVQISTIRLGAFLKAEHHIVTCTTSDRDITTSWDTATDDEFPVHTDTTSTITDPKPLSYVVRLTLQDLAALKKQYSAWGMNYRLAVKPITPATLICSLPVALTDDTYTSRALDVTVSDGIYAPPGSYPLDLVNLKQQNFFPHQISLHNDDAQEIHVTNVPTGETLLASSVEGPFTGYDSTDLHHAVTEHFTWESKTATSRRDILITVIGTLIALGAAALIEACRPYIDLLVRTNPQKP